MGESPDVKDNFMTIIVKLFWQMSKEFNKRKGTNVFGSPCNKHILVLVPERGIKGIENLSCQIEGTN